MPLAIGVLQVIALDIGSDMLPALALGAEPPRGDAMRGRSHRSIVDRALLLRAFLVLGATEAVVSLGAFLVILVTNGWRWGGTPAPALLAVASGTAFAAISLGQMATAFACRSTVRPVWRVSPPRNPLVTYAVGAQVLLLGVFLGIPFVASLLGGTWPSLEGWLLAAIAIPAIVLFDALSKFVTRQRGRVSSTFRDLRPNRSAGSSREWRNNSVS